MSNNTRTTLVWREIPGLGPDNFTEPDRCRSKYWWRCSGVSSRRRPTFACISLAEKEFSPTTAQLLKHPLAMVALVPKDGALFAAGAMAGAFAKTVIAPLDRVKLLMQWDYTGGFVPNALKTLPNSSIRLTTFDTVKRLIAAAEKEYQKIIEHNCKK